VAYDANPLAHAAASIPNHLALEVQDLGFPDGLVVDQQFEDGNVVLGESHGLGITVDEALIDSLGGSGGWGVTAGPHVRPERAGRRLVAEESPTA
jgi:L-alanine-DL-glutamate epimerase-like enolase superfamily enzyme